MFTDHLDTIRATVNPQGIITERRYTPYGEVTATTYPDGTPAGWTEEHGYTNQRHDPTGLYDYRARHYDPVIGRFTQPDTIIPDPGNSQTLGRYTYVTNNPVNYNDPDGHDPACMYTPNAGCSLTYGLNYETLVKKWDADGIINVTVTTQGATTWVIGGNRLEGTSSTHRLPVPNPGDIEPRILEYDLGFAGDPQGLLSHVVTNCASVFPVQGCTDGFAEDDEISLVFNLFGWDVPASIRIDELTDTSFSFLALPGHVEGEGRRIQFQFLELGNGRTTLRVTSGGPGSGLVTWPVVRDVNGAFRAVTWQALATNILETYGDG